ncbi:hypothetical protein [Aureimonas sp. ME7]|uniref:hypothetical protein n=1 Tax=Aureimonas sp. ME7 TaxID=2744252 RepID=UPI0015F5350D|nr:hypothetical protein [Aureimonas sp. ME7]
MKTTILLGLSALLALGSLPAGAQPFARLGNAAPEGGAVIRVQSIQEQLNRRIELQVRENERRGLTNSRAIQREQRRDRADRRWERREREQRRWDREERRRDRWEDRRSLGSY